MRISCFYSPIGVLQEIFKFSSGRVFLVGGALRDMHLERPCRDFDFAVNVPAIALARRVARQMKGALVVLDKERGSARVVKTIDGLVHTFDFTQWRADTIDKDLRLRDFTINALAVDIVDYAHAHNQKAVSLKVLKVPHALRDLKDGIVRMRSPQVFKEDPLRLLRGFSLQATLGFRIEPKTSAQMAKDAHQITRVAVERIREEFFKILASSCAAKTIAEMDSCGLLPCFLPQITVMYGVLQGGYHHRDVWQHSLQTIAELEKILEALASDSRIHEYLQVIIGGGHTRLALLKMAALVHDIGKPQTRQVQGARVTFHGHEHVGERITRLLAKQLKVSVKERFFLEDAVRWHLWPGYLSNFKRPSAKAIFRYMRDTKDEAVSLALLAMADQAATQGPLSTREKQEHHRAICWMLIEQYFKTQELPVYQRFLTGNDLIRVFKLEPSPIFGKILSAVQEETALGKIQSKKEALAFVRHVFKLVSIAR